MQVTPVNLKIYTGLGVVAKKKNHNKTNQLSKQTTTKNPMPANTHLSYPSLEVS